MPKVTEEHRAAMRRRIQQAAMRCARRKGLAAMSMNDVIRESGLSAGAIYGYFSSKNELITSISQDLISNRFEVLDEFEQQDPVPHPLDAIADLVLTIPSSLADDGVLLQVWGLAPIEDGIAEAAGGWLRLFTQRMERYTAAWLRDRGSAGEDAERQAAALAPVFIGAAQGYFVRGALLGPDELATYRSSLHALATLAVPPAVNPTGAGA